MSEETKVCNKCGIEKPATTEYFNKAKTGRHGLNNSCRDCQKQYLKKHYAFNKERYQANNKQYREENKEHVAENQKKYRSSHKEQLAQHRKQYDEINKEERTQSNKAYYESHKEQYKNYNEKNKQIKAVYSKTWYQANKERVKETFKEWQKLHPNAFRIIAQRRRAKKSELLSTLTAEQWEHIKKCFNNKCCYCGKPNQLEQEHFIPLSKGGEYTHDNIVPACRNCNSSKRAKDFFDWYPHFKAYSKKRETAILKFLNYDKSGTQQLQMSI